MPNRDGTGPQGKGPKTGRGQGCCEQSFDKNNNQEQKVTDNKNQKNCGRGQGLEPCGNMTQEDDTK